MNKEIEIEMRKYRADRGREMEREREKREKARESREATSGSTGRLGWAVGAALREVRLQAGAGEIELHIQDGDPCGWRLVEPDVGEGERNVLVHR